MRSWLTQSLRVLEDMVDSGELSAEELKALARSPLMPSMSTLPPSFDANSNVSLDDWYGLVDDAPHATDHDKDAPDDTGVHASQPASHRSGTMMNARRAPSSPAPAKRTGTKK